jgi:hypothetical protein
LTARTTRLRAPAFLLGCAASFLVLVRAISRLLSPIVVVPELFGAVVEPVTPEVDALVVLGFEGDGRFENILDRSQAAMADRAFVLVANYSP